eukprot:NODE_255_length_12751_cov_0.188587.p2 type:complete len:292 gc:universal NODE_255_length_12751_cov_0.188587:3174-2299(-)
MTGFSEALHSLIQVQNGICIVKEYSVELYDFKMKVTAFSKTFENIILKCVEYENSLVIGFDNSIIQLNLFDFEVVFKIDSPDEIRDICIHMDVILLCFQTSIGKIGKDGDIIIGSCVDGYNLSTLVCTNEYIVAVDFDSKLVYFDYERFDRCRTLDYSPALDFMSENPPFPLLVRCYEGLFLIGTLNGIVIIVSPRSIYCEHSSKIRYLKIEDKHVYCLEFHNYVISDIIFYNDHMFVSSNDRSVTHFELSNKLEFKNKYPVGMRAESLLLKGDKLFVCGVDSPYFKKINI